MPSLPRLAAPAPAAAPTVRRTPPALPPPLRPPCRACSLGSGRRPPRPPSATAADAPRGGPIPEPEEVDQHLLAALHAARIRDEESRRSGSGAKVSRNCVLLHTPLESPDLQEGLSKNGFNGNRLSLWVLQGLPLPTITSLENLLLVISNLAMKGSIFMGELPHFPGCTASMDMGLEQENLEKLFFTQGFQVSFVRYDDVVKDVGLDLATPWEQRGRLLFVAEQLRFSDAQMESFRMHFERIEEDADEDGFEEL
ncbi:hypothetical protein PAHAL_2G078000 [Panicum hallii]|uniref:Uncharacterized protein n=1 Tax=Panicum hallii TaxID=206008 RepID=A0A2S3GX46_9POAL|nr:hypothetical protein PAHAL_2G078000 [Panicum hallii]